MAISQLTFLIGNAQLVRQYAGAVPLRSREADSSVTSRNVLDLYAYILYGDL